MALTVIAAIGLSACDNDGGEDPIRSEPYRIGAVEVNGDAEREEWAFGDEHISRWTNAALEDSDRGISQKKEGMEMRVVIHHRVRLVDVGSGARLVIDVDARAQRSVVNSEDPMVTIRADAQYRHLLARGRPADGVLHALSRTLGRQAVDDVVHQLRLRARIRQSDTAELASWIEDDQIDDSVRRYAIRRALIYTPDGLEEALVNVTHDADDEVAPKAARALVEMESDDAPRAAMRVAQRLSRDEEYDRFLQMLPLLAELDEPWVEIYLETVAEAHSIRRVRSRARSVMAGE